MKEEIFIWLGLLIVFLIIEIITVDLQQSGWQEEL